eukprot:3407678-Pleurochrysis_carterae.AAC.1
MGDESAPMTMSFVEPSYSISPVQRNFVVLPLSARVQCLHRSAGANTQTGAQCSSAAVLWGADCSL